MSTSAMRWQKLAEYIHRDLSVTNTDDLLVSDSLPPYCITRLNSQPQRYLAFFGISSAGNTASCLGGFSSLASAKEACAIHHAKSAN
jgi:hypothetical protein